MSTITNTTPTLEIPAGIWDIDPAHTEVGFAAKHSGVATVRGRFSDFDGTIECRDGRIVRAGGGVRVASVDTRVAMRDDHLCSSDFFDADNHPEMRFTADQIEIDGDEVVIDGHLTLRGVTGALRLVGEFGGVDRDPDGDLRLGLSVEGKLSRAAYGMRFNQMLGSGNVLVGDTVRLTLDVSAVLRES